MMKKKSYKSICVSEITKDVLVFHLADSKLEEEELLIIGLSQFIELVGYKRPDYVIIDKKEAHVKMVDKMKEYLKHQGIDELMNLGVKKILFVVSEERHKELNGSVGYRGTEAYTEFDACIKEIEKHRKSYPSASGSV